MASSRNLLPSAPLRPSRLQTWGRKTLAATLCLGGLALIGLPFLMVERPTAPETDIVTATDTLAPLYRSIDRHGRAYQITGARVAPTAPGAPLALDRPVGQFDQNGEKVELRAGHGVYESEAQRLVLTQGVTLSRAGAELRTDAAQIDLANGHAVSTVPVAGHARDGTQIRAEGLEAWTDPARPLTFKGPAVLILPTNAASGNIGASVETE